MFPLLGVNDRFSVSFGLARLSDGQGTSPLRYHRQADARENEAREDGDGENIFLDLIVAPCVGQAKDNMLDFVVHSATGLEGVGLRVRRKIMEVGLEKPKGLDRGAAG